MAGFVLMIQLDKHVFPPQMLSPVLSLRLIRNHVSRIQKQNFKKPLWFVVVFQGSSLSFLTNSQNLCQQKLGVINQETPYFFGIRNPNIDIPIIHIIKKWYIPIIQLWMVSYQYDNFDISISPTVVGIQSPELSIIEFPWLSCGAAKHEKHPKTRLRDERNEELRESSWHKCNTWPIFGKQTQRVWFFFGEILEEEDFHVNWSRVSFDCKSRNIN